MNHINYYNYDHNELKRPDERYLSPLSHATNTINPFSSLEATCRAACIVPPLLTPANIAYYFASLNVILSDSY